MIHQRLIVIPFFILFYSILRVLQTRALNIPTKKFEKKNLYENSLMEIDIQTIIIINSLKKKKEKKRILTQGVICYGWKREKERNGFLRVYIDSTQEGFE